MDILILSYSQNGSNGAVAAALAGKIGARYLCIATRAKSQIGPMFSTVVGTSPTATPRWEDLGHPDFILLCAPTWMGRLASPVRTYLKELKKSDMPFAVLSVSGRGRENSKVPAEIVARAGRSPRLILSYALTDFLPPDLQEDMQAVMAYRLSPEDVESVAVKAAAELKNVL